MFLFTDSLNQLSLQCGLTFQSQLVTINIQHLYALSTLYLCFLYLSENKQRLVPIEAQTALFKDPVRTAL